MSQLSIANNYLPVLAGDSLDAYLKNIVNIPTLSSEEEMTLAEDYVQNHSLEAAHKLVLSNLKFVVHIVRGYTGYGLNQVDLIQEGNIGLMKAVKRFKPEKKVRLITFAVHWIRAEIHEFIIRNWRIVKIATTKEQRKLFFNLRKKKTRLGWVNQKEAEAIAKELDVNSKTVFEMDKRMGMPEYSFDLSDSDDTERTYCPSDYLQSDELSPEQLASISETNKQDQISYSLSVLGSRSREIIQKRWLSESKATLHDLAEQFGISAERVRQIEQSAMKQMKQALVEAID